MNAVSLFAALLEQPVIFACVLVILLIALIGAVGLFLAFHELAHEESELDNLSNAYNLARFRDMIGDENTYSAVRERTRKAHESIWLLLKARRKHNREDLDKDNLLIDSHVEKRLELLFSPERIQTYVVSTYNLMDLRLITQETHATRVHVLWMRFPANVLIVLGILATLFSIHSVLSSGNGLVNTSQLAMGLLPSIVAIACVVILSLLIALYHHKFRTFVNRLDEQTLKIFIPAAVAARKDYLRKLEEMRYHGEHISASVLQISQTLAQYVLRKYRQFYRLYMLPRLSLVQKIQSQVQQTVCILHELKMTYRALHTLAPLRTEYTARILQRYAATPLLVEPLFEMTKLYMQAQSSYKNYYTSCVQYYRHSPKLLDILMLICTEDKKLYVSALKVTGFCRMLSCYIRVMTTFYQGALQKYNDYETRCFLLGKSLGDLHKSQDDFISATLFLQDSIQKKTAVVEIRNNQTDGWISYLTIVFTARIKHWEGLVKRFFKGALHDIQRLNKFETLLLRYSRFRLIRYVEFVYSALKQRPLFYLMFTITLILLAFVCYDMFFSAGNTTPEP